MPKILNIVGARPNFMKIAPIQREMLRRGDSCGSSFTPGSITTPKQICDVLRKKNQPRRTRNLTKKKK